MGLRVEGAEGRQEQVKVVMEGLTRGQAAGAAEAADETRLPVGFLAANAAGPAVAPRTRHDQGLEMIEVGVQRARVTLIRRGVLVANALRSFPPFVAMVQPAYLR